VLAQALLLGTGDAVGAQHGGQHLIGSHADQREDGDGDQQLQQGEPHRA